MITVFLIIFNKLAYYMCSAVIFKVFYCTYFIYLYIKKYILILISIRKNIYIYIYIYINIYIRGVRFTIFTVRFDTIQWCHGSVRFRYGGEGSNWLRHNVSVLNHEGEPMDITQGRVCTRVCTLETMRKIYAGEHLSLSNFTISKVKI